MPSLPHQPDTLTRVIRIISALVLIAAAIWLINLLRNVLLPFCVACLISYLMYPLVQLNARCLRIKRNAPAALLAILEVTIAAGLLVYFFLPSVISEVRHLAEIIHRSATTSGSPIPFLSPEIANPIREWVASIDINTIIHSPHLESLISSGGSVLSSAVSVLLHTAEWLLTFIYVIFILIDYRSMMNGFRILVPKKARPAVERITTDVKESMDRYFRGQLTIAACAALLYCIGFSIVGIPMAIILGLLVGILYIIPYFQYVTIIPVAIVCFIDAQAGGAGFWTLLGKCLIVYVASQCICDYLLTPKIMGKALGLNPAIILLSLSVWGTLLGIIGMIIALPATALLLSYYQQYINGSDNPGDSLAPLIGSESPQMDKNA
ncbi:MAG: AI-2E family transporter [Pseudoflavonifractor sp.]|nr:AI-2E family transporter [Alloprevotella sp.]MCM1116565.1 AI-2E family transporter [Pseudoflavonifractor sp.]